jgi:DNA-binding XRE family transcriptional regulator
MPELIEFLQDHKSINIASFAREVGCSRQMIDYILIGKYKPKEYLRIKIMQVMVHYGYKEKSK